MTRFSKLWQFLEVRDSRIAVLSEWNRQLADEFKFIEPLLSPLDELAEVYPNPERYGLPLRIVIHSDDNIVAVSDERTSIRMRLKYQDIVQWKLQMDKLRKLLADSLGLRSPCHDIDETSDVILIGKYRPKAAAEFPVYLAIVKERSFLTDIDKLCKTDIPFILLVTSLKECPETVIEQLQKKKSVIVALEDIFEYTDSKLLSNENWCQCLSTFAQNVNPKGRSNFSNRPSRKGQKTASNIRKLKEFIVQHIRSQYDRINHQIDSGRDPESAPILEKQQLGQMIDIRPDEVTRAFKAEPQLKTLLKISYSNDEILKFGKRL
ncbi:MAG: hypothetical protein ABFD79_12640 [Phycisphaerales bacterium]